MCGAGPIQKSSSQDPRASWRLEPERAEKEKTLTVAIVKEGEKSTKRNITRELSMYSRKSSAFSGDQNGSPIGIRDIQKYPDGRVADHHRGPSVTDERHVQPAPPQ